MVFVNISVKALPLDGPMLRPTPEFSSQERANKAYLEHLKSLSSDYYCDVADTATSRGSDFSSYSKYLNKTAGVPWHIYEEYGTVYSDLPLRDRLLPEREFVFTPIEECSD